MNHIFNLKQDKPDSRDHFMSVWLEAYPTVYSGFSGYGEIWNQGAVGSCSAHEACGCLRHVLHNDGVEFEPSRMFYYNRELKDQGTPGEDAGSTIRQSMKTGAKWGVCSEGSWPYGKSLSDNPGGAEICEAEGHKVLEYARVAQNESSMKMVLSSGNYIGIGVQIYESFESQDAAETGHIIMPDTKHEQYLGGHALCVVGYTETLWEVVNSWGKDWGDGGRCWFPREYLLNPSLASDFWVMRKVS